VELQRHTAQLGQKRKLMLMLKLLLGHMVQRRTLLVQGLDMVLELVLGMVLGMVLELVLGMVLELVLGMAVVAVVGEFLDMEW